MPEPARVDTAHELWDRWWTQAKTRSQWSDPDPAVTVLFDELHRRGVRRVLDVGAGIGRHALAYAAAGFEVVAADASRAGLDELARRSAELGVTIECHLSLFTELPLADESVDHVLAWNVLYHGDGQVAAAALRECRRLLTKGGTLQFTMLSKRHGAYGVGEEIRTDTYVDPTSVGDKDHPHLYVDGATLTKMVTEARFEVLSLIDVDQHPPGQWHWSTLAEATER